MLCFDLDEDMREVSLKEGDHGITLSVLEIDSIDLEGT